MSAYIPQVCFTGSSAVGHKIVSMAAESNMKRVTLELGGKSPLIIMEDADLEKAADIAHVGRSAGVLSSFGARCL